MSLGDHLGGPCRQDLASPSGIHLISDKLWWSVRPPLGLFIYDGDWLQQVWLVVDQAECNILRIPAP
jgi:hypothetical protein